MFCDKPILCRELVNMNYITNSLIPYLFISLCIVSGISLGATPSPRPAQFSDSANSLQNLIKFPKINGDVNLTLHCEAVVLEDGRFGPISCSGMTEEKLPFWEAISEANYIAQIVPAKLRNVSRAVRFIFSLNFVKQGGATIITALPNHGLNVAELGLDYSAAQPVLRRRYSRYLKGCSGRNGHFIEVHIDTNGEPSNPTLILSATDNKCNDDAIKFVEEKEYIPAFKGKSPVASKLLLQFRPYHIRYPILYSGAD